MRVINAACIVAIINFVSGEMDGKVSQFVTITGATSDVAKRLLEACGDNLDLAINMHLESGGNAGSSTEMETTNNVLSPKSYEEMYGDVCMYVSTHENISA